MAQYVLIFVLQPEAVPPQVRENVAEALAADAPDDRPVRPLRFGACRPLVDGLRGMKPAGRPPAPRHRSPTEDLVGPEGIVAGVFLDGNGGSYPW